MADKINTGIAGIRGYAGEELFKILSSHRNVNISHISARLGSDSKTMKVSDIYPNIKSSSEHTCVNFNVEKLCKSSCDVIFLALPHGVPIDIVPEILKIKGKKVIDLSADYRINSAKVYKEWYGIEHNHENLLKNEAVFGLPEINKSSIKSAQLIANPGCYPTSILLPCAPFRGNSQGAIRRR